MFVKITHVEENTAFHRKKVEILKMNNKFYIELNEFEEYETLSELTISLAAEVDILRERIKFLEERVKTFGIIV